MKSFILVLVFCGVVWGECNILALSGGGAHGAFEVGVIKNLQSTGKNWNVYTGVSAGSLNAGILSRYVNSKDGIDHLERIYNEVSNRDIYTSNFPFTESIYSTEPLLHLIHQQLGKTEFDKSIYPTFIGMTNFTDGHLSVLNVKDLHDADLVYLASSSIPVIFPSTIYKDQHYVDGGLSSDSLIWPAVEYCIREKMFPIHIDHVSTYDPNMSFEKKHGHINIVDSALRTFKIISNNFDNIISKMHFCGRNEKGIAEIHMYYPSEKFPYGILDFTHGGDLIDMGFHHFNMNSKKLC